MSMHATLFTMYHTDLQLILTISLKQTGHKGHNLLSYISKQISMNSGITTKRSQEKIMVDH